MTKKAIYILCLITIQLLTIPLGKANSFGDSTKKIKRVLILGNSITIHKPDPNKGWYGNWGMAASEQSKDFVHILIKNFQNYNKDCEVKFEGVALNFERKFWKFDTTEFLKLKAFNPDLIIVRLGENVADSLAKQYGYSTYLKNFVNYIKGDNNTKICITNSFWPKKNVDKEIENTAIESNWTFVNLSDLFADKSNAAIAEYKHAGVGRHPSDKGMQKIADRIWEKLSKDLKLEH